MNPFQHTDMSTEIWRNLDPLYAFYLVHQLMNPFYQISQQPGEWQLMQNRLLNQLPMTSQYLQQHHQMNLNRNQLIHLVAQFYYYFYKSEEPFREIFDITPYNENYQAARVNYSEVEFLIETGKVDLTFIFVYESKEDISYRDTTDPYVGLDHWLMVHLISR